MTNLKTHSNMIYNSSRMLFLNFSPVIICSFLMLKSALIKFSISMTKRWSNYENLICITLGFCVICNINKISGCMLLAELQSYTVEEKKKIK